MAANPQKLAALLSGQDSDYDIIGYKRDRRRRPKSFGQWVSDYRNSKEGQDAALMGVAQSALSGQARNEPGLEYKPGEIQLTPLDTMAGPLDTMAGPPTDIQPNKPVGPDLTSYQIRLPSGETGDVRNPTPAMTQFAQEIGYGPGGYGSPELTAFTDFAATQDLRHPEYGGVDLRYFEPNLQTAFDLPAPAYNEPFEFAPPQYTPPKKYSGTGYYSYAAKPGAFAAPQAAVEPAPAPPVAPPVAPAEPPPPAEPPAYYTPYEAPTSQSYVAPMEEAFVPQPMAFVAPSFAPEQPVAPPNIPYSEPFVVPGQQSFEEQPSDGQRLAVALEYQQQQEQARLAAEAETMRMAQMQQAEAARLAEQQRLAEEARLAEAARLAEEERKRQAAALDIFGGATFLGD